MIHVLLLSLSLLLFLFIAWRDQKLAIYVILTALPSYLLRFHLGPVPMTLLEGFVLIALGVWILRRRFSSFSLSPFSLPTILLLVAAVIGVIVSPDKFAALGILKAYFIEPILFFLMIKSTLTRDDVEPALKALGVGAIVVSTLGILQWITRLGIPVPWDIERRITSVFDFPNAVGLYLGPIVTMSVIVVIKKFEILNPKFQTNTKHEKEKPKTGFCLSLFRFPLVSDLGFRISDFLFWLTVAILGTLAIFAAQTEAAYVAIPASLLLVSFLNPHLRRLTIPLTAIGFVAAMMIPSVKQKLTLHDYSGEVRRTQWSETVEMLKDHPIFGAGLAGYEPTFASYHHATWVEIFQYPHNLILNIWSELGLLGLVAFILLAIQVLRSFLPLTKGEPEGVFLCALLAALLETTIHGLVDVPYFKNDLSLMTWSLLAMLVISSRLDQSRQK